MLHKVSEWINKTTLRLKSFIHIQTCVFISSYPDKQISREIINLTLSSQICVYIYIHIYVCVCVCLYIYVCVCVCVLFGPVKLELGVIPSGQKKTFNSEHLNFPSKELNVTDVTEQ